MWFGVEVDSIAFDDSFPSISRRNKTGDPIIFNITLTGQVEADLELVRISN